MSTAASKTLRNALKSRNRSIAGWLREAEQSSTISRATWESYIYGRRSPRGDKLEALVAEILATPPLEIPAAAQGLNLRRWLRARLVESGLSTTAFARLLRCDITHLKALLDGSSMPRTPERHAELVKLAKGEPPQ